MVVINQYSNILYDLYIHIYKYELIYFCDIIVYISVK